MNRQIHDNSRLIHKDMGNLNRLIINSPRSLENRQRIVLKSCGEAFQKSLHAKFGEGALRFSAPSVVTDTIHPGSTIRVNCQSNTESGDNCSVRVTIGAIKNDKHQWVLEDRALNMDRMHNACEDCKDYSHRGKQ